MFLAPNVNPKLSKFSSFDKPWRYQICIAKRLYFIETICPKMRSISPLKSAYIMSTKRLKTPPSLAQFPGILNKDGKAPPRAPAPRPSIYHFWQKRYAFRILVFKIWINHWQKRTFSRLLHSHKMYLVALLGSFTDRKWLWNTQHFHCGRQEEPAILMSRARFPRKMVNFHQRLSQILSKVFLSKDIQQNSQVVLFWILGGGVPPGPPNSDPISD